MDADALVLESGWNEFTDGWGEKDHDFYVPSSSNKQNQKNCHSSSNRSTKTKKERVSPIQTKPDPTAMLIKYEPQFSPASGSSSRHIRPWTRGKDDIIHRGAKLAEVARRKSRNSIEIDMTINRFHKTTIGTLNRPDKKTSFVFTANEKQISENKSQDLTRPTMPVQSPSR